ncbi:MULTISPECIES: DUF2637 domain-containing protein [unclassified Streptomyces]|uniref:DUF2637 domain-containing protein n=1 Tax=unclassified Streptomyces TaxID=2593676 RepID=UPI00035C3E5C|nr:DUF2637 domain-containing protein [Streptomyces sp. BoleA5]MYX36435.1 DUF2637 domain-containing protein [Streptomyces sp. SID8377]
MNLKRKGRAALVLALVGVVGMAFRVSWNALRDVATTIGADATAATLYPFVVDGLMALALIATLVLTDRDRKFALKVLATYTVASLLLNYVHGLVPELHGGSVDWGRLADWDPANWALVLLATSLPVGSIYFGSDLVAKVLHHQSTPHANAEESTETKRNRSTADLEESTPPAPVPAPVAVELPAPTPPAEVELVAAIESAPVAVAAAESTRPRGATGRVPEVARTPRPVRTADELLIEAREATAGWPIEDLTAEGIRRAVRTSPAKARVLRETLRSERTDGPGDTDAVA